MSSKKFIKFWNGVKLPTKRWLILANKSQLYSVVVISFFFICIFLGHILWWIRWVPKNSYPKYGFWKYCPHGEVGYINPGINLVPDWTKLFFISKQKTTLKNFENPFNQQKMKKSLVHQFSADAMPCTWKFYFWVPNMSLLLSAKLWPNLMQLIPGALDIYLVAFSP